MLDLQVRNTLQSLVTLHAHVQVLTVLQRLATLHAPAHS
jgi:hypothetical protein